MTGKETFLILILQTKYIVYSVFFLFGSVCPSPSMQTNGCLSQENGEAEELVAPSTSHINGTSNGVVLLPHGDGDSSPPTVLPPMTETDKDIVRLIGQHLQSLGLQYVQPDLFRTARGLFYTGSRIQRVLLELAHDYKDFSYSERLLKTSSIRTSNCLQRIRLERAPAYNEFG